MDCRWWCFYEAAAGLRTSSDDTCNTHARMPDACAVCPFGACASLLAVPLGSMAFVHCALQRGKTGERKKIGRALLHRTRPWVWNSVKVWILFIQSTAGTAANRVCSIQVVEQDTSKQGKLWCLTAAPLTQSLANTSTSMWLGTWPCSIGVKNQLNFADLIVLCEEE